MNTALVIMAAGIGSRFGGGIKQLEPIGPNGEIIMDYSVHDALRAGFNKVVFIIRKDIEEDFKTIIGNRISKICDTEYVFQELDNLPAGFSCPPERKKPWGTGQAVLACKGVVNEPFCVINADDYYGREAFVKIHEFLVNQTPAGNESHQMCMVGYQLDKTLSENGGVTRGICHITENNMLSEIAETKNIVKTNTGAAVKLSDAEYKEIPIDSVVSMNMWGFKPAFIDYLDENFGKFLASLSANDYTSEYLVPVIVDSMLKKKEAAVHVLYSADRWFGITYKEDKESVMAEIKKLIESGMYDEKL